MIPPDNRVRKFIYKLDFGVEDICINDRCWNWNGTIARIMYDYSMLPDVSDMDCERLSRQMSKYEREKLDGPR